tara:strand:- start:61 stop:468 length:408 start_codon:yes stop_codon:yes gene_type:complete
MPQKTTKMIGLTMESLHILTENRVADDAINCLIYHIVENIGLMIKTGKFAANPVMNAVTMYHMIVISLKLVIVVWMALVITVHNGVQAILGTLEKLQIRIHVSPMGEPSVLDGAPVIVKAMADNVINVQCIRQHL